MMCAVSAVRQVYTHCRCSDYKDALRNLSDIGMLRWFAVRTSPCWELRTSTELFQRGFETYVPLCHVKRKWSDRTKVIDVPLFPGYLFTRFLMPDRIRVLQVPGVKQIVGIGETPAPISESEIDNLR